jgi:hypothetical protein
MRQYDSDDLRSQRAHIFELSGGLGNQLFQIEAAEMLCLKPVFDTSMLRPPFMNHASLAAKLVDKADEYVDRLEKIGFRKWSIENKIYSLGNILSKDRPFLGRLRLSEPGYDQHAVRTIVEAKKDLIIRGYFQSYKYLSFSPQGHNCRAFPLTSQAQIEIERLRLHESPWAWMHVRRGDFQNVRSTVGLLGPDYYRRGLEIIKRDTGIEKFVVFTDDFNTTSLLIDDIRGGLQMVHSDSSLDVASTLSLMNRADGAVLGNSTFSYWGAARNPNIKRIVTPLPWFKNAATPVDLIPPHWHRVESDFI